MVVLWACLPLALGFSATVVKAASWRGVGARAQPTLNGARAPRVFHAAIIMRNRASSDIPSASASLRGKAAPGTMRPGGAQRHILAIAAAIATVAGTLGARPTAATAAWSSGFRHDAPAQQLVSRWEASHLPIDARVKAPDAARSGGGGDDPYVVAAAGAGAASAAASRVPRDAWEAAAAAGWRRMTRQELMALNPKLHVRHGPGYNWGVFAVRRLVAVLTAASTLHLAFRHPRQLLAPPPRRARRARARGLV
jgi:hypothetical protein